MSGPDPYESSFNESSAEQGFVKEPMDFWTEVEPFLYVGIIVTILGILVGFLFMRRRKRGSITLADLGVTVEPNCVRLPWEEIDMYHETKERLWELYGNNCEDNSWLATLNDNAKNMLKYRLMRRAVGVIDALHGVQTSRRAYFKMYSNKIIPESAWAGFQEAEANVSAEIEAAQQEASYMEPTHNSESVIQNAIKCWQQGGRDWGKSSNLMTVEDSIQQVQKQIKENYDPRDKMAELASKGMKGMGDALKEKGKGKGSAKVVRQMEFTMKQGRTFLRMVGIDSFAGVLRSQSRRTADGRERVMMRLSPAEEKKHLPIEGYPLDLSVPEAKFIDEMLENKCDGLEIEQCASDRLRFSFLRS